MEKKSSAGLRRPHCQPDRNVLTTALVAICVFFTLLYNRASQSELPQQAPTGAKTNLKGGGLTAQEEQEKQIAQDKDKWKAATNKCSHPRKNQITVSENVLTPGECSVGWGTEAGVSSGQNLEDAVMFNRFFSGSSPLAHLGQGNGNGKQVDGIYLEMGALDGVTFSNSRLYEYCAGWDGILIEAQPENVKHLYENRPCAIIIPEGVCGASKDGSPSTIRMSLDEGTAFDLSTRESSDIVPGVDVPCRPLSTMLEEYGVNRINFFSLDVEGAELKVLETFDFKKVKIDVLMVEGDFIHSQGDLGDDVKAANNAKVEAVRTLVETMSDMKRVPSRLDSGETDERLCARNGITDCLYFSIAGSDVFVSPELYEYDTKPWTFTG
ncbi:methyltransferase [Fragilaria crotonensis]|nr:methyltransferase [Fragilaria crotonensis]